VSKKKITFDIEEKSLIILKRESKRLNKPMSKLLNEAIQRIPEIEETQETLEERLSIVEKKLKKIEQVLENTY